MEVLTMSPEELEVFRKNFFPECVAVFEIKANGDFVFAKVKKEYTYEVKIANYNAIVWLFCNDKFRG